MLLTSEIRDNDIRHFRILNDEDDINSNVDGNASNIDDSAHEFGRINDSPNKNEI